jgi:hypothetical protein
VGYQIAAAAAGIAAIQWLLGTLAQRTSLQIVPPLLLALAASLLALDRVRTRGCAANPGTTWHNLRCANRA